MVKKPALEKKVKVVLLTAYGLEAGHEAGAVITVPEKEAEDLISWGAARFPEMANEDAAAELETQVSAVTAELEAVNAQLDAANAELEVAKKEVAAAVQLSADLDAANTKLDAASEELEAVKKESAASIKTLMKLCKDNGVDTSKVK